MTTRSDTAAYWRCQSLTFTRFLLCIPPSTVPSIRKYLLRQVVSQSLPRFLWTIVMVVKLATMKIMPKMLFLMLWWFRCWWGYGDADDQMLAILNQAETPTTAGVGWAKTFCCHWQQNQSYNILTIPYIIFQCLNLPMFQSYNALQCFTDSI